MKRVLRFNFVLANLARQSINTIQLVNCGTFGLRLVNYVADYWMHLRKKSFSRNMVYIGDEGMHLFK